MITMNTYTNLGVDDAKDEMICLEELEFAKKKVEKCTFLCSICVPRQYLEIFWKSL